jgi:hypothetical protein
MTVTRPKTTDALVETVENKAVEEQDHRDQEVRRPPAESTDEGEGQTQD